jgi:heat-inducible transcriptional repressor
LVLNERLVGLTLKQIRSTIPERLRDTAASTDARELLNIFVQEGDQLFDVAVSSSQDSVLLGGTSVLVEQPEFATGDAIKRLLALTDRPGELAQLLRTRGGSGISITIGAEHKEPDLAKFTLVTAEYHAGPLAGVIGVIGPTRMPYDKVISLVTHTSRMLSALLE